MWKTEKEFQEWLVMMINEEINSGYVEAEVLKDSYVTDAKTITVDVFDKENHDYEKEFRSFIIEIKGYEYNGYKGKRMED